MNLIHICHRCPHVDWKIQRKPPCKINDVYFADNAASGICPDTPNRFSLSPEELAAIAIPAIQANETAIPRDQWPPVILDMAAIAKADDVGIGDVYARNPALWHEQLRAICKTCDSKFSQVLNRMFPLPKSTAT